MTLAVVLQRAVRHEFDDAAVWYEGRRPGLGAEFTAEIERALGVVAVNPDRFPLMHRDVRCVRARRFPYSVFFRVETARIVVLAIFHARRNPIIWQRRV